MPKITFKHKGSFSKTERFLSRAQELDLFRLFDHHGTEGVLSLMQSTPEDTGVTKNSWDYRITRIDKGYSIIWYNTNMAGDTPVVILLQYGHGTGWGTYVQGIDFINPAMKPIFDKISDEIEKEVAAL